MPARVPAAAIPALEKRKSEEQLDSAKKMARSDSGIADAMSGVSSEDAIDCINTIRCISAMLPQQAKSGHPGAPMGCSVMAYALWNVVMHYSPSNPHWWNRDRFVLSNGHACALQYTMLHLTGYDLSKDDLKQFRQLGSKCPGHPEVTMTPGIEVVSGPLGQGISQAVGMAVAAHNLAAQYNEGDMTLFDNFIYCICGDGCLQEGVSGEACSFAGCNGLGRLICLYDSNRIQIDGSTEMAFTENVGDRFKAYGWDVSYIQDGDTDLAGIVRAVAHARTVTDKPSLIVVNTTIGFGSTNQGSHKTHGAPLGLDDIKQFRSKCGFSDDSWDIPAKSLALFRKAGERGTQSEAVWNAVFKAYREKFPIKAAELDRRFARELPADYKSWFPVFKPEDAGKSTRDLSEICLNAVHDHLPELIGGSADLTGSNKTALKGENDFSKICPSGKYLRFGVREHAMVAMANGIFLYGGFRPFTATFLNFYTYAWGACRLSSIGRSGLLNVASHDSIELGEDGPTHQPIETISLIRATPNTLCLRPCDGNETAGSYAVWLEHTETPCYLCLSRDKVPNLAGTHADSVAKGAYVLTAFQNSGKPKVVLAGSGTEMQHAVKAATLLSEFDCQVVSMPCWELFAKQPDSYREAVIPSACKYRKDMMACYIEASSTFGIEKYFDADASVGMTTFGESGPAGVVQKHFGFTAEKFAEKVRAGFELRQKRI